MILTDEMIAEAKATIEAHISLIRAPLEEEQRIRCEELHHQGMCAGLCVPFDQRIVTPKAVQLKEEEDCRG